MRGGKCNEKREREVLPKGCKKFLKPLTVVGTKNSGTMRSIFGYTIHFGEHLTAISTNFATGQVWPPIRATSAQRHAELKEWRRRKKI